MQPTVFDSWGKRAEQLVNILAPPRRFYYRSQSGEFSSADQLFMTSLTNGIGPSWNAFIVVIVFRKWKRCNSRNRIDEGKKKIRSQNKQKGKACSVVKKFRLNINLQANDRHLFSGDTRLSLPQVIAQMNNDFCGSTVINTVCSVTILCCVLHPLK